MSSAKIIPIPCLQDNYAYLLVCIATGATAVIDPSEAAPVIQCLKQHDVLPTAILNTHHHWDHTNGNEELQKHYANLKVYGHRSDFDKKRIPEQSEGLEDEEQFMLGNLSIKALHTPGHTTGALSYWVEDAVFTGDTLFAAGCGRVFEGTAEMMHHSLNDVLGVLPEETKVYFGHEYTANNLRFSANVEPDNAAVRTKVNQVKMQRDAGQFTTPSTMKEERATNPFLRCQSTPIIETLDAQAFSPQQVFGKLRAMKDQF